MDWFPDLPSYQSYNRRLNRLNAVFSPLVEKALEEIDGQGCHKSMPRIVDSMPTRVAKGNQASQAAVASERTQGVGYCSSKDTFYHGVKLHVVAERRSDQLPLLRRAGLTPGSENDLRALRRVLPEIESGVLCGDWASCDGPLKEQLAETQDLDLLTPVKKEKGQRTLSSADKLYSEAIGRILSANRVAFQLDRRENGNPEGLEGALLPGTSCTRIRSARCRNAGSRSQPLIRIFDRVYARSWHRPYASLLLKVLHFNLEQASLVSEPTDSARD
ncbi:hypothetical protein GGP98_002719 [Salinibacter ruber]|uniref:Transposase DDE domain-containing protein n=1 Tax=Salinibacter ruber TaxID=146919 RepID=A0A9X2ZDA4_9BACT|nr:transposase [Salinibacter ruber]MBB4090897.1 hypothetical protein [Salinibacter ruber]MCS3616914.1 hypothetical protein [Salinibacter ruber]MCS3785095.1 hypothetical protein [Salinibacter ruber]MCS4038305.1 hypothetical protein [Salinibacter ruber]